MPNFIIALLVVVGGLWFIRKAGKMPPAAAKGFVQKLAGGAIIAFAGLMFLRGQTNAAIGIFMFGLGLLGKSAIFPNGFGWPGNKSTGQKSRVATSFLSMELDHDSGTMDGDVLQGPTRGKRLSALNSPELQAFHGLCMASPDQSRALLEAWLDRNHQQWREEWQSKGSPTNTHSGPMSADEARAILGLKPNSTDAEIRAAHRRLMKEFHPDKGGSDYLAAKINAAKDVLTS